MFNHDFYELKKVLEGVTIEVTDLKKRYMKRTLKSKN
jgi:hypothetical protein